MTDRKKVDIAIFECSEENEVENLRQVVICPPFQKVGKEGRHQDPRRRTRKDNQRLNADCDGVCDLVLRSDSKSSATDHVLPAVCGLLHLIRYRSGRLLNGSESPAEIGGKS